MLSNGLSGTTAIPAYFRCGSHFQVCRTCIKVSHPYGPAPLAGPPALQQLAFDSKLVGAREAGEPAAEVQTLPGVNTALLADAETLHDSVLACDNSGSTRMSPACTPQRAAFRV